MNGGTWTTGKLTGGMFLDGTNTNYVNVANATDLSPASFTLAAWIKPVTLTGYQMVLSKGISKNTSNYWLGTTGNQISFGWFNGARREFNTTTANLSPNTWYHIAASYDASSKAVNVYLNGALQLTQTAKVLPITNIEAVTLGTSSAGENWQGVLDDVWIQQGALSSAQVAALAGTPSPGTPVTVTLSATADTSLSSSGKNNNYGTDPTIYLGGDLSGNQRWALLAFGGVSAIPAGATIVSATLSLYEIAHGGSTAIIMDATDITQSWVETTATWSKVFRPTLHRNSLPT